MRAHVYIMTYDARMYVLVMAYDIDVHIYVMTYIIIVHVYVIKYNINVHESIMISYNKQYELHMHRYVIFYLKLEFTSLLCIYHLINHIL